jgi:hypothetical protein
MNLIDGVAIWGSNVCWIDISTTEGRSFTNRAMILGKTVKSYENVLTLLELRYFSCFLEYFGQNPCLLRQLLGHN